MRRRRQNVISIVNLERGVSCPSDVGPARHPREAVELGLVARRQLGVYWRERRLLPSKLFVEVAGICTSILWGW